MDAFTGEKRTAPPDSTLAHGGEARPAKSEAQDSHLDATGLASPPPTSCGKCGDHFRRASDAMFHVCRPNDTGFNPNDTIRVGDSTGTVMRVDRGLVEVKFRGSFRLVWCSPDLLERVA